MKNFKLSVSLTAVGALFLVSQPLFAQSDALDTEEKRYSYAVGSKIAAQLVQQFGRQGSGIDFSYLRQGLNDVLSGTTPKMTDEEADLAIEQKRSADQAAVVAAASERDEAGAKFRGDYENGEGVQKTESGMLYTVMNSGAGDAMPTATDTVVVHYQGTLIDGTVFDSSYSRGEPATFPLSGIIPGWQEILQLMRAGDKWEVVIPPQLAYGERGAGASIGPNETLVFEIELLEIK